MGRDVGLRGHLFSGPYVNARLTFYLVISSEAEGQSCLRWYPVQPSTLDPWVGPWGRGYQEKWPVTGWASPGKQTVSAANEREPGLGPRAWGGAPAIAHPDSRRCRGGGGGRVELGLEMGSLRADKGSPRDPTLLTDGCTHRRTDRQRGVSQAPAPSWDPSGPA